MAETRKPWEGLGNVTVADAPSPAPAQEQPAATAQQPAQTPGRKPWEGLGNVRVVSPEEKHAGDIADATETALTEQARVKWTPPSTETWAGWANRAGRATLFGQLSDPIVALTLQNEFKDQLPDMTFGEALRAVRKGYEEGDKSITAEIAGAVTSGAIVGRGLKKLATKTGVIDGAMKWAAKSNFLNRFVGASAAGSAGGLVEEGIRSGLGESLDAYGGAGFDTEKVKDDVMFGAMLGALAGPVQEGARGAAGVFHWMKGVLGSGDEQAAQAASRVIRTFANEGEDANAAVERLRDTVTGFRIRNGYMPAMADILPPEKTRELSEVIRYVNGLDVRARELGEAGVKRSLKAYDDAIASGARTLSTEQIEAGVEDLFTDVIQRTGKTPVAVGETAMDVLSRNRGWINKLATDGNAGAQRIGRVLDAQSSIDGLRHRFTKFAQARDVAARRTEVASIRDEIANIISDQFNASEVEPSRLATLRDLERIQRASTDLLAAQNKQGASVFDEATARNLVMKAQSVIDDYEANGLKISLSDANSIRSTASRHFYKAADPSAADTAKAIRDAVAPIGTKEVPEYGDVVKRWRYEHVRSEAQATGEAAAKGSIDLGDLSTRITRGRMPDKPRVTGEALDSLRQGADEGARRQLRREVGGTVGEGVRSAQRVADSEGVQQGLAVVTPKQAARITEAAKQVKSTYESMRELAGPASKSKLSQERELAQETVTGLLFGGIGGAAKANLIVRGLMHLKTPRGTAKKIVEMLGNPKEMPKALAYMESRGIRLGAFFGAVTSAASNIDIE